MADVVCIGNLVADAVARPVDTFPERGKLTLTDDIQLHSGGCATNTGNALGKLGIDTAVIGKVGADGFGDFLIDAIRRFGVDTRGIVQDKQSSTSATLVMVSSDGERSFVHSLGANAKFGEEDVDFGILEDTKIVHIAGALLLPEFDGEPMANVLKRAKQMGLTTSLDTCWDPTGKWMETLEPVLHHVDVFLPSYDEARELVRADEPRKIAEAFMDYGIKIVGLKMGSQGCYIRTANEEYRIPVYDVEAVDATGAGDSFVGGFLAGLIKGWALEDIGRLANAVGACCVTKMGASSGILSWDDTMEFMKTTPFKK